MSNHNHPSAMCYTSDLSLTGIILTMANLDGTLRRLRRYNPAEIINAIAYVVRTGCQWSMLPGEFPHWKTVYHHFRSLSDRGWFRTFLRLLVTGHRAAIGQYPEPYEAVVDSQSVRWGLPDSVKGIDGHKRVKGIKRHVATDPNGYVPGVAVTPANIHDSKGAIPLIGRLSCEYPEIGCIKADRGYLPLRETVAQIRGMLLDCVKSNFGTADFVPVRGRWVVERTFAWMDRYRRLTRNYERLPKVAEHMFIAACVFFMLRYFG